MFKSFFNILILLPTLLLFLRPTNGLPIGASCNNGQGECKGLSECEPIFNHFNEMFNHIIFCDQQTGIVCCPKPTQRVEIQNRIYYSNKEHLFASECSKYSKVHQTSCPRGLIIGGSKADPKEFPHMALLGVKRENAPVRWICGGTLISPNFVLTAAHCFYDDEEPNYVRLGELDYDSTTDDAQPQDFNIFRFTVYPGYDFNAKYNDIALVELNTTATFNKYVLPACLPLSNGTEFNEFIAAGWGATNFTGKLSSHLLKVHLKKFDDSKCSKIIEKSDELAAGLHFRTQMCAGGADDGHDTCQGDSGGPLFVNHPDEPCMYLLIGVTSFGYACGIANSPGVYSRVNLFVNWIERIVWNAGV